MVNIKPQIEDPDLSGDAKEKKSMKMEIQTIQNKIHILRGLTVMLDRDLAEIYGEETRRLNEQVRRNIDRFPEDFMFQLTKEEADNLKSQIATSSWGGNRKLPYVFTELGVAMLSSVLNSSNAIQINISIMRAFVAIRQLVVNRPNDKVEELQKYVDEMFADQNDINEDTRMQLELINQTLAEMQVANKENLYPRRKIGFVKEE